MTFHELSLNLCVSIISMKVMINFDTMCDRKENRGQDKYLGGSKQ